jgi:hypothetical protein
MSAIEQLRKFLVDGESVEGIVFGVWGWGSAPQDGDEWEPGYLEPDPPPVPFDLRGRVMTLDEAAPYMESWEFYGGFGAPDCYAVTIWTDRRVIWVTQYDGSTGLDAAWRNPTAGYPDMPGG